MFLAYLAIAGVLIALFFFFLGALVNAPPGYENERGFFRGFRSAWPITCSIKALARGGDIWLQRRGAIIRIPADEIPGVARFLSERVEKSAN